MTASDARPVAAAVQSAVLFDELARCGIRDVVLCPGSRSAPLALAAHAADSNGQVRLHVRTDERSAGFLALGLATEGRPVVVIVTSGSAVSNLHPAVTEARYAGLPLVLLTADRPPELWGVGANQTIAQEGLFGADCALALSLDTAVEAEVVHATGEELAALAARWRSRVCRVVAAAAGEVPAQHCPPGRGAPVQLNVPLRPPLLPEHGWSSVQIPEGRAEGAPWTRVVLRADQPLTSFLAEAQDAEHPVLIIAGQGAIIPPALRGLRTLVEPGATDVRGVDPDDVLSPLALPTLLADPTHHGLRILVVGRPTLHRSVTALLADPTRDITVLDARVGLHASTAPALPAALTEWPDAAGCARLVVSPDHPDLAGPPPWSETGIWRATCRTADRAARRHLDDVLAAHPHPTGLHVARAVAEALEDDALLVLGPSNPVRDLSYVAPDLAVSRRISVVTNRGASGIDGIVSTAVGRALASGRRTVALVGDLTFLHDLGGLAIPPGEPLPADVSIVVANDAGGGIFTLLEQGGPAYAESFERVFGTPQDVSLEDLCAGYGVAYRRATAAELPDVLRTTPSTGSNRGLGVIEVPTVRADLRTLHATLRRVPPAPPGEESAP